MHAPGTPFRRNAEQIQAEIEKLREGRPADFRHRSARLLNELKRVTPARPKYAKT